MKKNRSGIMTSLLAVLASMVLLAGCGSSSSSASYDRASNAKAMGADYAAEEAYYDDAYMTESAADTSASGGTESVEVQEQDSSRKLIKNASLSVETEDYEILIGNVTSRVKALGGYIEDSYSYNGSRSSYGGGEKRYGNMTIRIPSKNLDEFLNNMAEISNITSRNYNVTDVTLQYVDVEARRDSLKTQHERLLEFMEQAETVEDIIALEERISDVEYQLDSAERQLRTFDNQVDYSTVTMDITEVEKYTPVEKKSRWQIMGEGFVDSLYDAIDNLLDFFVGLVVILPHLFFIAVFVLIIVLIVRLCIRSSRKKKAKKAANYYSSNGSMMQPPVTPSPAASAPTAPAPADKAADTKDEQKN